MDRKPSAGSPNINLGCPADACAVVTPERSDHSPRALWIDGFARGDGSRKATRSDDQCERRTIRFARGSLQR